ncbi:ATP-binding protein [Thermoactinospora rubra]|uniref:ATP-binding protein n=1 Tax=Thermoactinospora rubra TaxID=1088767 RepID=UPI00130201CF|nr:ATP-binding protein [Thermoactinospora rubra]
MNDDEPMNTPDSATRTSSGGARAEPAAKPSAEPELILDQPFDHDSLYTLRAALEAHASRAGLPDGRATDLVITVHELATNVVIHGGGKGRVQVWHTGEALRCEIADPGAPRTADPSQWPIEYAHGLWIARYLADEFAVAAGPQGTLATVAFALPGARGRVPFALTRRRHGSHTVVEVSGALDEHAAQQITAAVGELVSGGSPVRLVLDLSGVTFWDAGGVAALITVQQRVGEARGGALALSGLTPEFSERLRALSPVPFLIGGTPEQAARLLPPPPSPTGA